MSRDEDRGDNQPGSDSTWLSRDDLFDDLDSDGELEDPDRDTDFAAMYHDLDAEDEPPYFDDPPEDECDEPVVPATPWDAPTEAATATGAEQDSDWEDDSDTWLDDDLEDDADSDSDDGLAAEYAPEYPSIRGSTLPPLGSYSAATSVDLDEPLDDDGDDLYDEDAYEEYDDEPSAPTIPLGLIILGVIALVLLGAGGYGVMEQRAQLQEEVRQLQTRLATAASPGEVAKTRAANESLRLRNEELEEQLEGLSRENRTLEATVAGLEKQLEAQQAALRKSPERTPTATVPAPKPVARPAPKPVQRDAAPLSAAPAAAAGNWFVNFGSYGQEDVARRWAERLQPESGSVIVMTGEKDGRTFYRVRVVGLVSRDAANAMARTLERKYDLEKLWVGESG